MYIPALFILVIVDNGTQRLTHAPCDVIEQFLSNPNSFVNFLEENYLPHFSSADQVDKAASVLSDADYMLAEWRVIYIFIWFYHVRELHHLLIKNREFNRYFLLHMSD